MNEYLSGDEPKQNCVRFDRLGIEFYSHVPSRNRSTNWQLKVKYKPMLNVVSYNALQSIYKNRKNLKLNQACFYT